MNAPRVREVPALLFHPSGLASLLVGLALCVLLLAHGITEEVPVGGVQGVVLMAENTRPIEGATVILRAKPENEDTPSTSRILKTDARGAFSVRRLRAGTYTVEATAKAHSLAEQRIEVREGPPLALDLALQPQDPYLDLYTSQHVFTPEEKPAFEVRGFSPDDELQIHVFRVDFDALIRAGGLMSALSPFANPQGDAREQALAAATRVATLSRPIANRDGEGVYIEQVSIPQLPEGVYWVDAAAGSLTRGTYLVVTRIALVTKRSGQECLAFVTAIDSGKPLPGARVELLAQSQTRPVGVTDGSGLLRLRLPTPASPNESMALIATVGTSRAIVDGLGYYSTEELAGMRVYAYTDRPIYRPGDQVHFKGILRRVSGAELLPPPPTPLNIEVRDESDSLVQQLSVVTRPSGSYDGQFELLKEAAPGQYSIVTLVGQSRTQAYFTVASYQKPQMELKLTPQKRLFVRGERARVDLQADYYFGGPVPGAEVRAAITRTPYWMPAGEEGGGFEGMESSLPGEYLTEVVGKTDASGRFTVDFDTTLAPEEPSEPRGLEGDTDYLYQVMATVQEPGGRSADGQASVLVARGEFALDIRPERYVAASGQSLQATVRALEHLTGKPRPNTPVRVTVGHEIWNGREVTFAPESTQSLRTGPRGDATFTFRVSSQGATVLKASAQDSRGNTIEALGSVYSDAGGMGPDRGKAPSLTITLDRKRYEGGQTATALLTTNRPGGSVLVTVEGDGLYSSQIVALPGPSTPVKLPVLAEYAPNAYVSAVGVRDKSFLETNERLEVGLGARRLQVSLTSDRKAYHPGDTATYTIRTTSAEGRPAPAEVSLGVVDESIYALRRDNTDIVRGLYPVRDTRVQTLYSFPELYLDGGDKGPVDIEIRRDFRDTAFWQPVIQTDDQGTATVQVKLPDNLTRWRATAVAVTEDGAAGQATHEARVSKDLMVRLQTPVFLVQGDRQQVSAIVVNDSGEPRDVQVRLDVRGAGFRGPQTQQGRVEPGQPQTFSWELAATDAGRAVLTARAWVPGTSLNDGMELGVPIRPHGRLVETFQAGEVRDSSTLRLTVHPQASPAEGRLVLRLTPTLASSMLESLDELVDYPYGCVEQTMSRFLPTVLVAQAMGELGLPSLPRQDEIPRMVAEGFARLKKMQHGDGGWGWWEYDTTDPYMTAYVLEGLWRARAAGFQPDPFSVSRGLDWARSYLRAPLAAVRTDQETRDRDLNRLYLAYVLALYGGETAAPPLLTSLALEPLEPEALAFAALAYQAAGPTFAAQRDRALGLLIDRSTQTSTNASWPERSWGIETTGRALMTVATLAPAHPILPKVVRYLMVSRRGDIWWSTRDTSAALMGLTAYLRQTRELSPNYELAVLLNGRELKTLRVTADALGQPEPRLEVPISAMRRGPNLITIRKQGPGVCYYTADLKQTVLQDSLGQVLSNSGLSIERTYHRLSTRRLEDGSLRLMPEPRSVAQLRRGELVRCILKVRAESPQQYVMIEDPLPSNCRVMERTAVGPGEEWDHWWSSTALRDDRIAFFVRDLPKGSHVLEYTLRAEMPGASRALPSIVSLMYDPTVWGGSGETGLEVVE